MRYELLDIFLFSTTVVLPCVQLRYQCNSFQIKRTVTIHNNLLTDETIWCALCFGTHGLYICDENTDNPYSLLVILAHAQDTENRHLAIIKPYHLT